jgi:hypothetical protein
MFAASFPIFGPLKTQFCRGKVLNFFTRIQLDTSSLSPGLGRVSRDYFFLRIFTTTSMDDSISSNASMVHATNSKGTSSIVKELNKARIPSIQTEPPVYQLATRSSGKEKVPKKK